MSLPTPQELRDEAKLLVRLAAEPSKPGDSVKQSIDRAARRIGLSHGRVKRYWYGEIPSPPAHEVDAIRAAVGKISRSPADAGQVLALKAPDSFGSMSIFREQEVIPLHVLYDDTGEPWPVDSPELRENLGAIDDKFDVADFAVRCLGWLEVRHSRGRLHLRMNPLSMQQQTTNVLFRILRQAKNVDVDFAIRDGQVWIEEIHASPETALARAEVLFWDPVLPSRSRFVWKPQPVSVLFRDKQKRLISLLRESQSLLGAADVSTALRLAVADETGRTGLAVSTPVIQGEKPDWTWLHTGSAISFYTPDERARLAHCDVRHAPDKDYGEWCASAYDRAASTGETVVEDCRVLVTTGAGNSIYSRYRRLLIPIETVNKRSIVLISSEVYA